MLIYPLQSQVHECVSARNLSLQSVQAFSDIYPAEGTQLRSLISFNISQTTQTWLVPLVSQTDSDLTGYLFSVSLRMVDALEENVMKDILSMGLERKERAEVRGGTPTDEGGTRQRLGDFSQTLAQSQLQAAAPCCG